MRILRMLGLYLVWVLSPAKGSYDISQLLILDWEDEKKIVETLNIKTFPCLAIFKKDDFELHYIAADHSFLRDSPTFQMIEKEVETFNPSLMILEGFQDEWSEAITYEENKSGEPIFALNLAKQKGIKTRSGEPKDADLMQYMHSKFGSNEKKSEDVFAYYTIRMLAQCLRSKEISEKDDVISSVNGVAKKQEFFLGEFYGYEKLKDWLVNQGIKKAENLLSILETYESGELTTEEQNEWEEVLKRYQACVTQDMYCRDQTIVTRILEAYKEGVKKALVIYGRSHFITQYNILHHSFGEPKITFYKPKF